MPSAQLIRYPQILARMTARVVARADLTDLNDSSVVKHILAAAAREIDDSNYQLTQLQAMFSIDSAAGDDLDERAKDIQPGTLRRIQSQRAVGYLVFSRATNTGTTITIPIGSVVKTAEGVSIRTTALGTISNTSPEIVSGHGTGRDSDLIAAIAVTAGETGNIASATAVKFQSRPPGTDTVTNPASFVQGRGKESDDAFRERIRLFIASLARGTVDALKFAAIGAVDPLTGKQVIFAHVYEDPEELGNVTVYIDDGAGTALSSEPNVNELMTLGLAGPPADTAVGGEEFLFLLHKPVQLEQAVTITSNLRLDLVLGTDYTLNPASALVHFLVPLVASEEVVADYYHFTGLIAVVQKIIDGDPDDRMNYPGYRAAGVLVRVLTPAVVVQTVTATLIIRGRETAAVQTDVETVVSSYINTLGISGDVIRNELIEKIMGVEGVVDLDLVYPTENVTILDSQIARITSNDIDLS